MSFRGFLYVLSWISLCPITPISLVFTGFFSIRNQVSNQECNQVGNQVNQSRDTRPTVANDKRVGLAAPHPAAHKCAIVSFCLHKMPFQRLFYKISARFCQIGAQAPKNEYDSSIFSVFCLGDVSRRNESETLYLVIGTTTLSAKNL